MTLHRQKSHTTGALVRALLVLCVIWMSLFTLARAGWDETRLRQTALATYGPALEKRLDMLLTWLQGQRAQTEADKLRATNDWWNRTIRFDDDSKIWKQADYWATPLETLAQGAGDCEDFAIAKYLTLIELGVPESRLRLVYVRAQIGEQAPQAHMVLAYYSTPEAEPLILDNLLRSIQPASRRTDLTPLFSFNAAGVWVQGNPNAQSGADRLSRWQDAIRRFRAAGF